MDVYIKGDDVYILGENGLIIINNFEEIMKRYAERKMEKALMDGKIEEARRYGSIYTYINGGVFNCMTE